MPKPPAIKALAEEDGLAVWQPERIRHPEALEGIHVIGRRLLALCAEPGEGGFTDRLEDRLLVLEVAIRRHRAAAQLGGDRFERHTLEPVLGEETLRDRTELGAKILDLLI